MSEDESKSIPVNAITVFPLNLKNEISSTVFGIITQPMRGARNTLHTIISIIYTRFPLTRKVGELIWLGKSGNIVDSHGKMMCIVRVVWLLFVLVENVKYTLSALAPEMGQGITLNTVREFHFWSLVGTLPTIPFKADNFWGVFWRSQIADVPIAAYRPDLLMF